MIQNVQQLINGMSIGLDTFSILVSLVLGYAVFSEARAKKGISQFFFYITIANAVCALADGSIHLINAYSAISFVTARLYDLTYISFMVALMFFCFFQYSVMRQRVHVANGINYVAAFACGVPVIVWLVSLTQKNPWFYYVNEAGQICQTEYFWLTTLIPVGILVFNFIFILSCRKELTAPELFAWISYELFPLIVYLIYLFTGIFFESTVYAAFALSLILLYIQIHLHEIRASIATENELRKSQMKLMVSQIQPHFMYNALNSIYVLIENDPEVAQEAVSTFSDYLRQNINSLKSDLPVEFSEELEHTKAYLYLEQIRFGEKLKVLYDIQAEDFKIPPLTVQPLVENAVKHGISSKPEGGVLKISSKETERYYEINIVDDGLGFDASGFAGDDKHTHIGLFNVNSRLVSMVHGNLNVQSVPGSGTICTITIPKDRRNQ